MTKITEYLTDTNQLRCDQGDVIGPIVTNVKTIKTKMLGLANTEDKEPLKNIPLFGTCKILTQNAGGTVTPCKHNLKEWGKIKSNVIIKGKKALLKTSSLICEPIPPKEGMSAETGTIKPEK